MIRLIVNKVGHLKSELYLSPPQMTSNEVGQILYGIYHSSWGGARYEMIQFHIVNGHISKGYTRFYNNLENLHAMMLLLGFQTLPREPTDNLNLLFSFI